MICESCERTPADVLLGYEDGEVYAVCEDCRLDEQEGVSLCMTVG